MTWIAIGRVDEILPLSGRCVKTVGPDVGVFRAADDQIFAVINNCPHKGGPLSEGIVHGTSVTCPLHNMVISLASGEIEGPDEGRTDTIPVDVRAGVIHLDLPAEMLPSAKASRAA
ncbi:MAG: nitrite reductase small subunit NirD [Pseudomonadota bacterium]